MHSTEADFIVSLQYVHPLLLPVPKAVHSGHGLGHVECLPHSEQPGTLRVLRHPSAALPPPGRAHRQRANLYGNQPTGRHEGPEGQLSFCQSLPCSVPPSHSPFPLLFQRERSVFLSLFSVIICGLECLCCVLQQEGQLELKDLTSASLERLLEGHSALVVQQGALWEGQEQLETSLSSNLERLGQEKALIASGQELVAQLIQGITHRMGKRRCIHKHTHCLLFSISQP